MNKHQTVTAYIQAAPAPARPMLRQLRRIIRTVAPQAEEKISYGMPYYSWRGRLCYFAAFRDHVSYFVMPGAATTGKFAQQLKPYLSGKSTLQIPFGEKIPVALITKLVRARWRQNEQGSA